MSNSSSNTLVEEMKKKKNKTLQKFARLVDIILFEILKEIISRHIWFINV